MHCPAGTWWRLIYDLGAAREMFEGREKLGEREREKVTTAPVFWLFAKSMSTAMLRSF